MKTVASGLVRLAATAAVALTMCFGGAQAAERALGTYILGQAGPQAGMLPPVAGLFSNNAVLIYSGKANPSKDFPIGGNIAADVTADIVAGIPGFLWVPPDTEIFGGRVGVFGVLPIGEVDVGANITANPTNLPPNVPPLTGSVREARVSVGDPQAGALLGWNDGAFHWNVGVLFNIPIGDYELGALDNLSFNRFSADFFAGITWLDPATGIELSSRAGITVNAKNTATDYKTGEEFHIEFAALMHFSPQLNAGLVGYHYQQLTGDSGSGAVLGPFKGRATALGGHLAWTFPVNQIPVSVAGRVLWDLETVNRLDATTAFVTLAMPVFVAGPPPGAPSK